MSDLFVKPANGAADERPFLMTPQAKMPLDWSRDGRFFLYSESGSEDTGRICGRCRWAATQSRFQAKPIPNAGLI